MQAMAIDIRLPGIKTATLRDAALALHRGGVGYYASSEFVHVDVAESAGSTGEDARAYIFFYFGYG